jgi:aconitate hydratase
MGVLPLQFPDGESVGSLGLTGDETFDLEPLEEGAATLKVSASTSVQFDARVRIDTPNEWLYFRTVGSSTSSCVSSCADPLVQDATL